MVGLNPVTGVLLRRGEFGFRHTQKNHVRMEAEIGPLRNAVSHHAWREAWTSFSLRAPRRNHPAKSAFWTFDLQN